MGTQDKQPRHDESADQELSTSLAGHEGLAEGGDGGKDEKLAEGSPIAPLEEIDDSPVRTKNS